MILGVAPLMAFPHEKQKKKPSHRAWVVLRIHQRVHGLLLRQRLPEVARQDRGGADPKGSTWELRPRRGSDEPWNHWWNHWWNHRWILATKKSSMFSMLKYKVLKILKSI